MNIDFSRSMQEATDRDLIKIVTTDRSDYQEPAIIAAENELAKRNLTFEQIASAKQLNEAQELVRLTKANMPLDFHWKLLASIFPGIFQLIISGVLIGDGYDRKAKELTKWTLLGFGFYILLIILVSVL